MFQYPNLVVRLVVVHRVHPGHYHSYPSGLLHSGKNMVKGGIRLTHWPGPFRLYISLDLNSIVDYQPSIVLAFLKVVLVYGIMEIKSAFDRFGE